MKLGRFLASAAAVLLLAPAVAVAQSSIAGSVTDNTGGVLPGVTVEASSPVLIEGSRVVFTDGTGNYNIVDLRPGVYTVTFTLPGFGTQVRDELILGADVSLPINAVMSVGSVEETVTVSGETPVVDVQQVQRIEVMTRETQEVIPTGRSMWSYALLIPGVKVHKPDVGGTAGAQQSEMMGRGLDAAHTTVEIDGMMINSMVSDGRYQAYLNPMLSAETSYTTSGQGAEADRRPAHQHDPERGRQPVQRQLLRGRDAGRLAGREHQPAGPGSGRQRGAEGRHHLRLQHRDRRPDGPRHAVVLRDGAAERRRRRGAQQHQPGRDPGPRPEQHHERQRAADVADDVAAQDIGHVRQGAEAPLSQHAFGEDLETAASTWNSPHYDVGTAKWTGTLSNRMLAEFGFSLHFGDWDPGYYQYSSLGASDPGHRVERQGDEGTRHGSGGLGRGGRTSRAEGEGTHVGRARRRRRARFDG